MRVRLPDRRPSITRYVAFFMNSGQVLALTVTFGFNEVGDVREVFCDDFKAGSDMHATVTDACILLSRLLQHGDTPEELAATLCNPPSVIGTIAKAVSDIGPCIAASEHLIGAATLPNSTRAEAASHSDGPLP